MVPHIHLYFNAISYQVNHYETRVSTLKYTIILLFHEATNLGFFPLPILEFTGVRTRNSPHILTGICIADLIITVIFSQASVSNSAHGGGGVYPRMHWVIHSPGRHLPGQIPLWTDTPWADTPPGQTSPQRPLLRTVRILQ